jgi:SAM-dependent methyltransferase
VKRFFFELRYWLGDVPWDTGISPPELLAFLGSHSPGRALDLGCGTGTNALTMAERGWQVTAIDFSSRALRVARRRCAHAGGAIVLARGDVAEMRAATGVYDLALDIGCFHSLEPGRRSSYARSLRQRVRPGTTFLLYAFLAEAASAPIGWPSRDEVDSTFSTFMDLRSFVAGVDRDRPSAWFTFVARGA